MFHAYYTILNVGANCYMGRFRKRSIFTFMGRNGSGANCPLTAKTHDNSKFLLKQILIFTRFPKFGLAVLKTHPTLYSIVENSFKT